MIPLHEVPGRVRAVETERRRVGARAGDRVSAAEVTVLRAAPP